MQLYDYDEIAERLAVKKGTLYSWVSRNKIPYIRFSNRCVRFDAAALDEWVKTQAKGLKFAAAGDRP